MLLFLAPIIALEIHRMEKYKLIPTHTSASDKNFIFQDKCDDTFMWAVMSNENETPYENG